MVQNENLDAIKLLLEEWAESLREIINLIKNHTLTVDASHESAMHDIVYSNSKDANFLGFTAKCVNWQTTNASTLYRKPFALFLFVFFPYLYLIPPQHRVCIFLSFLLAQAELANSQKCCSCATRGIVFAHRHPKQQQQRVFAYLTRGKQNTIAAQLSLFIYSKDLEQHRRFQTSVAEAIVELPACAHQHSTSRRRPSIPGQ